MLAVSARPRATSAWALARSPPGTKLPSRSQLCKEYGVSDTVVGKAMMILRATGLTETLEGVGVFVAEPK
ncbi:GntR family transcriptional regulator [Micromonospora rhizosphaerae]|uniref:GntR family transcriptional regulator n=1 Tax=Micromonospora rhizosphaerae TaxID=568872 RepID=UPI003CCBF1EC